MLKTAAGTDRENLDQHAFKLCSSEDAYGSR
jgi:hypothetical protein